MARPRSQQSEIRAVTSEIANSEQVPAIGAIGAICGFFSGRVRQDLVAASSPKGHDPTWRRGT
jgi:hypothetical protein